jgi:hypothetical protein
MATTNWAQAGSFQRTYPHTFNALQNLVMAMADCLHNAGKKTWLGQDKGLVAFKQFEISLHDTLMAMVMDGVLSRGSRPSQCRQQLLSAVEAFAEAFPNWQDAYSFAYEYFINAQAEADRHIQAIFGGSGPAEDPDRQAARDDFHRVTSQLRSTDTSIQVAVGHGINMANSLFVRRFGSIKGFSGLPVSEKHQYLRELTDMEERLATEQPHVTVGFALFKMWIGAVTENDNELEREFSMGLAEFSRLADHTPQDHRHTAQPDFQDRSNSRNKVYREVTRIPKARADHEVTRIPISRGNEMKRVLSCPRCGQQLRVPSDMHLNITCPKCNQVFRAFTG